LVSSLPDNPLGRRAKATLEAAGVDARLVPFGIGRMGLYFFEPPSGPRGGRVTYDRADSVFALAKPADFDFTGALVDARLLHVSGITPALGPGGCGLLRAAIAAARAAAVPVSFDGNYRASLWEAWDSDPRAVLTELVSAAQILFGNHRDISLMLGREFSGEGPDRRREAAEAAFAAFPNLRTIASTARQVIDGGHHRLAARVDAREGGWQTEAIDITGIVDRIGTGDAFAAGVLHRHLTGGDPRQCAEAGLALAERKHAIPGDMVLTTEVELPEFAPGGGDVQR
jgi:2-dehydro-3-deoxygluconokinase